MRETIQKVTVVAKVKVRQYNNTRIGTHNIIIIIIIIAAAAAATAAATTTTNKMF
jgi:hypothetical protein